MTVAQLIARLRKCDPRALVVIDLKEHFKISEETRVAPARERGARVVIYTLDGHTCETDT